MGFTVSRPAAARWPPVPCCCLSAEGAVGAALFALGCVCRTHACLLAGCVPMGELRACLGHTVPVDETVVKYPTLAPDTHGVGNSSGYNFPNSSGFTYQAEAVHRCLAAGLLECPQYTKEESLCVTKILDGARCTCALHSQRSDRPLPGAL